MLTTSFHQSEDHMPSAEVGNSSIQTYSVSHHHGSMEATPQAHSQNGIETPLSICLYHTFPPLLSDHNGE